MLSFTPSVTAGAPNAGPPLQDFNSNGKFTGLGVDQLNPINTPFISVTNDVQTFDSSGLAAGASTNPLYVNPNSNPTGLTNSLHPYVNFTASDLVGARVLDDQVFELGNSLSSITGEGGPPTPLIGPLNDPSQDPGNNFFNCVYDTYKGSTP